VRYIRTDFASLDSCRAAVQEAGAVTHMVYAARAPFGEGGVEDVPANVAMLRNLLDAADTPSLRHVHLVEGGKWYGMHLGQMRTPMREDDPRHMPPNFYYDQEDFLRARQRDRDWNWTVLRPDVVCGFSVGSPMNLVMIIAVYAAISKELGLPLRFPGKLGAYTVLCQVTSAKLLAQAALWSAVEPGCANEIINIANGDFIRWQHVWPKFAEYFGMRYELPQTISLAALMRDKAPVWDAIVEKHGLRKIPYEQAALWPFGDFIFGCDYDVMSDMTKARQLGFTPVVDSEAMFLRLFDEFRSNTIIP